MNAIRWRMGIASLVVVVLLLCIACIVMHRTKRARVGGHDVASTIACNPPRLAILNTLPYHYECIGHVLESAQHVGIEVDVFMHTDGDGRGWMEWYARLGLLKHVRPVAQFEAERSQYTHVFAINGVDLDGFDWISAKSAPRTACIVHIPTDRFAHATRHVHPRPFTFNASTWVMPVYRMCSVDEKLAALSPTTSVVLIGNGWAFQSVERLRSVFATFDTLSIHIVNRKVSRELQAANNITIHENIGAEYLADLVMRAHYVAAPFDAIYDDTLMSGCIPMALSAGARLILGATQNTHYQFRSALVVEAETIPALPPATADTVHATFAERDRLIDHRDTVYRTLWSDDTLPKLRFCTASFPHAELPATLASILQEEQRRSPDYELRYFDDQMCDDFVACHFPQFTPHYRNIIPSAYQADLWRLMVLFIHGGVYTDIGAQMAVPLSTALRDDERLVMCVDSPTDTAGIYNAFIAARPGHPALSFAIEHIVHTRLEPRDHGEYTLDVTGPQVLGRAMRRYWFGVDDGRKFKPGDYGAYRLFDFQRPALVDDRGDTVVRTFKFDGYYDVMYANRSKAHYYELWTSGCVFRDRSDPDCDVLVKPEHLGGRTSICHG